MTPFTLSSCKDKQYCVYTSMQNVNGHRVVYVNNQFPPGEFTSVSPLQTSDFICFAVQGAQASS